ncbi:hypothetical protein [Mycobacteroides abscessus]|uniref:hypothetical protein n=1 Tax=Mycobacteroides abscessus TaxID=36809 RepID=UPI0012FFF2D3|nr:hypothetical protein [Mycobacteroides abscessus]
MSEKLGAEDVMAGALAASLRSDERSWITQRNWDAAGGIAVRLHIRAMLAALKANGYAVVELPKPQKSNGRWSIWWTNYVGEVWSNTVGTVKIFAKEPTVEATVLEAKDFAARILAAAAAAERDSEDAE